MTTEANKALVRRWLEDVWNNVDLASIDGLFAPTYTVNSEPCSLEAVKQAVQLLHTAFAPVILTIDDLVAEGDKTVVRWAIRGVHVGEFMNIAPTNNPVVLRGINIYQVTNGKIATNHEQVDLFGLLHQLGASTMQASE